MSVHLVSAEVRWQRGTDTFTDNRYSRGHTWRFDGGIEAAKRGFRADDYVDAACGELGKNAARKPAMTRVTLHPRVMFSGVKLPSGAQIEALHHEAHEECFIASSVTTDVQCEPVLA